MSEKFTCKVEGRLGGDAKDLQEAKLLHRIIRWTPEGILYEADLWHAGLLKSTFAPLHARAQHFAVVLHLL
eukprot:15458662-Alexandrium_andersonii.AAC.1